MSHLYSPIIISLLLSFNSVSSQEPENRHKDFENLYATIESKAFDHERLAETRENVAHYRNLFLGSSMYISFELFCGAQPSQALNFGFSQWLYPISGLCISSVFAAIANIIEHHDKNIYELPVIHCFKQLDQQHQNKLIHTLEEKNMAIPSRCVETVSVVKWLRACQQKALTLKIYYYNKTV